MSTQSLFEKLATLLDRALNPFETLEWGDPEVEERNIIRQQTRDGAEFKLLLDDPTIDIHLSDVESFIQVLQDGRFAECRVFASFSSVYAKPVSAHLPFTDSVSLKLTTTRAWKAIIQLDQESQHEQYRDPRKLWKTMITDLADGGTEELQIALQEVNIAAKQAAKNKQDELGIVQASSASTTMDISWGNGKKQLPTQQIFKVKVWEEADITVDITARIEATNNGGLGIALHIANIEAAKTLAVRDLIDNVLGKSIEQPIYQGSMNHSGLLQQL